MKSYWRKAAALVSCAVMGLSLFGCTEGDLAAADTTATAAATETAEEASSESSQKISGGKHANKDAAQAANTAASVTVNAPVDTDFTSTDTKDTWGLDAVKITLNGTAAECSSPDVTISGSDVTITKGGSYLLSGTLDDGQIVVAADAEDDVQLVLNGAAITNDDGAAIEVKSADKVVLTLAPRTENTVTDGETYADSSSAAANAAIYSEEDLSINGTGSLTVNGNYNNGIATKDDLAVVNGSLTVKAENHGLKGNDSVAIGTGTFTIQAGGDGIQADKTDDPEKGWIIIEGGTFDITAGNDGIQAVTGLTIHDGDFNITTNGGSENGGGSSGKNGNFGGFNKDEYDGSGFDGDFGGFGGRGHHGHFSDGTDEGPDGTSDFGGRPQKGSGAAPDGTTGATTPGSAENTNAASMTSVMLSAASENDAQESAASADSETAEASPAASSGRSRREKPTADSTVSSESSADSPSSASKGDKARPETADGSQISSGGTSSSYKGIKTDAALLIDGGTFNLNCADDAVHSNGNISLEKGTFTIASRDDAIHADGTLATTADITVTTSNEGIEGGTITVDGGNIDVKSTDDGINASGSARGSSLTINDGTIIVEAGGDGLDANGDLTINGGNVTVIIDSSADNGGVDCEGTFTINGGNVVYGGTGTGMAPSANGSSQSYVYASGSFKAGENVTVRSGLMEVMSAQLPADCSALILSAPGMSAGTSYDVYCGREQIATATAGQGGNTGMGGRSGLQQNGSGIFSQDGTFNKGGRGDAADAGADPGNNTAAGDPSEQRPGRGKPSADPAATDENAAA